MTAWASDSEKRENEILRLRFTPLRMTAKRQGDSKRKEDEILHYTAFRSE